MKIFTKKELLVLVPLLTVIFLFINFIYCPCIGKSMDHKDREWGYGLGFYLLNPFAEPQRGDVVAVVPDNGGQKLSKRLIGLPGETIKIQNQKVYINGEELIEDYAFYSEKINRKYPEIELTLGEDEYFVLGDNRMISADSLIYYVYLQNGKPIEDTVGVIHRRYLTSAFYSFSLDDFVEPLVNIYLEYKERKL